MLVLTRNKGQSIMINDNIEIAVLAVGGSQTRFGITAPRDVAVHREEIYQKIQQSQSLAEQAGNR